MMPSYQYRDSHAKDKTVSPTVLSLTWESPYLRKTVFILRQGPGGQFWHETNNIHWYFRYNEVHTQFFLASSNQQNPPFSVYAPLATSLRPHHPGWVVDGGHYEWSRPHLGHSGQARVGSPLGAPSRCRPRRQSSRSHPAAHSSIGAGWTHCSAQHDRYWGADEKLY